MANIIGRTAQTKNEIKKSLRSVAEHGICGPGTAKLLDIGTSEYLDCFEQEVLCNLVGQGGSTCKIFEGAYGAGKSHLLQLIKNRAQRRGFAWVETDLNDAINLEDWKLVTQHVLSNLRMEIAGETVRSLGNIALKLGENGMANIERLNSSSMSHSGLKKSLCLLAGEKQLMPLAAKLLIRFSNGDNIRVRDLRRNRIMGVKGSLTRRNAEIMLNSALTGLYMLSGKGSILLFDENEKSFVSKRAVPSKKVRSAANMMRRFIDSCMSVGIMGTVAVFAVLPDFMDNCSQAYAALGQRLETDMLYDHRQIPGWCSPVTKVSKLSTIADETVFLEEAVKLFKNLIDQFSVSRNGIHEKLMNEGRRAIETQAGEGYRRNLMKKLATITYQTIYHN